LQKSEINVIDIPIDRSETAPCGTPGGEEGGGLFLLFESAITPWKVSIPKNKRKQMQAISFSPAFPGLRGLGIFSSQRPVQA
jgi:hypothetical protein